MKKLVALIATKGKSKEEIKASLLSILKQKGIETKDKRDIPEQADEKWEKGIIETLRGK